ncbi:MAG: iron-containing alcohol dehydrogenase [Lachnospiraceae bacterium]|nr:iron-containing alcohol dehydrogenase [Candidatus Minthocola equi]
MYKIYCRIFQAVMKLANYFLGYRMPDYIEGTGCVVKLPEQIKEKGLKKVLFVSDPGLMKIGLPTRLLEAMDKAGLLYAMYTDVQPNPTSDNVEDAYKVYCDNSCEGIVAMGGGSPMDCAKGVAAKIAHPKKSVAQLQGLLKVHKKIVPFWAIPTTSGTGSETTVAAVITDSKTHHKASINDPAILPKYAVLDPELTVGLPPFITATTGMDALCHAVESYTNWTYCTKLEKDLSKKAVKLIYDNLLKVYNDGSDLEARQNMQFASFYAGRSFTRGCVGYVHAVGHTLGGLYGVAHGLAMSVILPHVMRQFGPAVYDKLADLADVCGMTGADNKEKALKFIDWIDDMKKQMNLPAGIDAIKDEDIPQIIKWAEKESNPLYPVPVIWGDKDFEKLIDTLRTAQY